MSSNAYWTGKQVLVTGAGGFIGSNLAERLLTYGAQVRGFIHYNSSDSWGSLEHSEHKREINVVSGDIRDRDSIRSAMKGCDVVFHLAALIGIPYSYHAPLSYIRTNVEGTFNVLSEARDLELGRLIHTSTSEVYGSAQYVPMDEHHPQVGQSPYSASKIGADKMAEAFHRTFDVPVAIIRPFNTYGPRQSARAIIPTIISQALSQEYISVGNLQAIRDFNYVEDLSDAYLALAGCDDAIGKTVNVGTGVEISIDELAKRALDLIGKSGMPIVQDPDRIRPDSSEVDRLCADSTKAQRLMNWTPQHTFDEGLQKTIDWIRNHSDIYRTDLYAI